jgi:ribose transport system substrate-binding protein
MKRRTFLGLGAMALAGCTPAEAPSGAGGEPPGRRFTVGMSQCNLGEPWRVQMSKEIEAAAASHPDLEVVLRDAQNRSETQQSQVREFIQQRVDLLIISPKEARPLTRPVEEAMEAGIPVIVLDRKVEGNRYTCFIGADNVKIGRAAGEYLADLLGGKGNVVELQGLMTSTPGQERHDGFMQGIEGSNLQIVFRADCQWLEPNAQREMKSALAAHPQIDAVFAHNDPSAHGAYLAARQEGRGRERTIRFIGIDALPHEGVRYVREGILTATFEYPTGGREAIDTALRILRRESVEKNITLGTRRFTQDNVESGGQAL